MVHLVALLEPAQDTDGVFHGRLCGIDLLETALEGGVLFDVLAVLIQRGCANKAQLAAGQHGLNHVARIHGAFAGSAGADDGVQLIDEGDNFALRLLNFIQNRLEALLELAAELGAGDHGAKIQADKRLALQGLGDVASHDAAGQALNNRSLADARLTNQHRIILRPARKHLDDAPDFLIAPDDRVDLALARPRGEVGGVLFQRLELVLRVLRGHLGGPAHGGEGALDGVVGCAAAGQQLGGVGLRTSDGGEEDFGGHELIAKLARQFLRLGQYV